MSVAAPEPFRWSRDRYERMVEAGILGPETRVQLLDGEVIQMTPQGSRHAGVVRLVETALRPLVPDGHDLRSQMPLALDDRSEPEPDVAIVPGAPRQHILAHPSRALLVVEVSESSLGLDRTLKQRIYARNAVPEYWVVNLVEAALEVHRDPRGDGYRERRVLKAGATIEPLPCPSTALAVADLLP